MRTLRAHALAAYRRAKLERDVPVIGASGTHKRPH